jgi:hypothetical protein
MSGQSHHQGDQPERHTRTGRRGEDAQRAEARRAKARAVPGQAESPRSRLHRADALACGEHIHGPRVPRLTRSCSLTDPVYFFPDLAGISEDEEQAAIDAGEIQANRIAYVGRRR